MITALAQLIFKTNHKGESGLSQFLMSLSRPILFILMSVMFAYGFYDPTILTAFFAACNKMPVWIIITWGSLLGIDALETWGKRKGSNNGKKLVSARKSSSKGKDEQPSNSEDR